MKITKLPQLNNDELTQIMRIWLQGNLTAHSFVDPGYWKFNEKLVRSMMKKADIYVAIEDEHIIGFAGLQEQYLAGIFIESDHQHRGIGSKMIEKLQQHYHQLKLNVYQKNKGAINFYLRHDFQQIDAGIDEETNEPELTLQWNK